MSCGLCCGAPTKKDKEKKVKFKIPSLIASLRGKKYRFSDDEKL